jgi:hypothetical protein
MMHLALVWAFGAADLWTPPPELLPASAGTATVIAATTAGTARNASVRRFISGSVLRNTKDAQTERPFYQVSAAR